MLKDFDCSFFLASWIEIFDQCKSEDGVQSTKVSISTLGKNTFTYVKFSPLHTFFNIPFF